MDKKNSLVHYSNPFLIHSGVTQEKVKGQFALGKYVPIRKTAFDKRHQIREWIEDLENNSTIEELLNTVIKPVKFEDKGNLWL